MKSAKRWAVALVIGGILASATCALAQDWPQWRGANRDGKVTGFTAPEKWPAALTQKWKVAVGTGDATPALVGDKLYVFARQGDDEVTLCLNAADGKEVWKDKYASQAPSGPAGRHPGPRGSPAVADGKVVTLGVGGVFSCLSAADGKVLWRKDDLAKGVPQFSTGMSPIIADGMAIAHLGGKENGVLVALDLATGSPKWKWTGEGPAYDSPVLATLEGTKQLVLLTEKSLVGIGAADGKLLWQVPASTQNRFYNSATPIVDGSTVIFTGQGKGTKAVKIEKQGDGLAAKDVWSNEEIGTGFNSPVLKDGKLYGLSDKGSLFCLDAQTGKTAWADSVKRNANFGAIVDAGSCLLALPSDSQLVAFKPGDKEYTELAKIKVADTATYAHPVVAGKGIFVKDQDSLILWSIE